ncbi:5283_t:CDS:2 [Paraglomus brasilianum]|uniref:5283_t:CDS:1 n=1 Tax=Paraglomus brasilianum TaxID=144538 RepID=A0A9N8WAL0_9GLOM|nr:5283_t:CDS:2 [Paraglomus brasilianum]
MTFSLVSALRPFKIPLTLSYPFINHHAYTRDSHSKQHKESIPLQLAYTEYFPRRPQEPEESPPIIILHGLFGSKQNWKSLAKSFAQSLNTKVYAADLRNHGESPHSSVHTYESMASDVAEFIVQQKLDRSVLIGHSMGGKVVMTLALLQYPQVSQVIVVDTAPVNFRLSSNFSSYIAAMKKVDAADVSKQSFANEILEEDIEDITVRQFLLTNLTKDPQTGLYKWRIPLDTLEDALNDLGGFPFKSAHHTFKKRALFIAGTKSNYVPPKVYPTIRSFFPNAVFAELDAGHWVHAEKPHEFTAIVSDFIKSTAS